MHTLTYTPLTSRLTGRGTHFSTFTRYASIHDDPFQGVTCSPRLRCSLIMYQHIGRYQRSKHRKSVASLNTTRRLLCMFISSYGRHVVQKKLRFRVRVRVSRRSDVLVTSLRMSLISYVLNFERR